MSEIIQLLEKDTKFIQELFSFDGSQDAKTTIDMFINSMQNSTYGLNYFIQLLDVYSITRIKFLDVSKNMLEAVFNCYPDLAPTIKHNLKGTTHFLYEIDDPSSKLYTKIQDDVFQYIKDDNVESPKNLQRH